MTSTLAPSAIAHFDNNEFQRATPFPYWVFDGLLHDHDFTRLCGSFPAEDLFEVHTGIPRVHGQRPHDRLYLAYETSLYHQDEANRLGVVRHEALSPEWRRFIEDLQGAEYHGLIARAVGRERFSLRFAWHIGTTGSEVSPHVDAEEKLGTHIFYFNEPGTWQEEWGGATCLLGDRKTASMAPDLDDFGQVVPIDQRPNRSLVMRNREGAWHGVAPLSCPPDARRRLFNVVIEPAAEVSRRSWLRRRR